MDSIFENRLIKKLMANNEISQIQETICKIDSHMLLKYIVEYPYAADIIMSLNDRIGWYDMVVHAIQSNLENVALLFIDRVTENHQNILNCAVKHGYTKIIKILLDNPELNLQFNNQKIFNSYDELLECIITNDLYNFKNHWKRVKYSDYEILLNYLICKTTMVNNRHYRIIVKYVDCQWRNVDQCELILTLIRALTQAKKSQSIAKYISDNISENRYKSRSTLRCKPY